MTERKAVGSSVAITDAAAFQAAFDVSRETLDRLALFGDLVRQWQKAVNLVANSTLDDLWHRHIADSAQLVALAPEAEAWLDIGAGGGFPGMVVAIMRAERGLGGVTLIESDKRKCAFLKEVRRQTGVAVEILDARIESETTHSIVGRVNIVSARALAPLSRLMPLAAPYLTDESICLFMKGRSVSKELIEARASWDFGCDLVPSITEEDAQLAVISRLRAKLEG